MTTRGTALFAVASLVLAACSSGNPPKAAPTRTSAATTTSASTPSDSCANAMLCAAASLTAAATDVPPDTSTDTGSAPNYSLINNWQEIKNDLRKSFNANCPTQYSCTAADYFQAIDAEGSGTSVNGHSPTKITVDVTGVHGTASAKLVLSKYAQFFSTDNATPFDFLTFVNDNLDEPIGETAQESYDGVPVSLEHTAANEWVFTVGEA